MDKSNVSGSILDDEKSGYGAIGISEFSVPDGWASLSMIEVKPEEIDLDALDQLFSYYVQQRNRRGLKSEVTRAIGLIIIANVGFLYGQLALQWARSEGDSVFLKDTYFVNTILGTGITLINTTNLYLKRRDARRVPKQLKHLFKRIGQYHYLLEDLVTIALSALGSVTLALLSWHVPKINEIGLRILWSAFIEADNTFLHTFPVELLLRDKYFGSPFRGIKMVLTSPRTAVDIYRDAALSESKIQQRRLKVFKDQQIAILVERFQEGMRRQLKEVLDGSFKWQTYGKGFNENFCYKGELPEQFAAFERASLDDLLRYPLTPPSTENIESKRGLVCCRKPGWMRGIGPSFSYLAGVFMMVVVWASCYGYYADATSTSGDPENGLGLSSSGTFSTAFLFSFPSNFLLGLLLVYIGLEGGKSDARELVIKPMQGEGELPFAVKQHTKMFGLQLFVNLVISFFSSGGAVDLVNVHVSRDAWYYRPIYNSALWGVRYLAFKSFDPLYKDWLEKFGSYSPQDGNRMIAEFKVCVENMIAAIPHLQPEVFLGCLQKRFDQAPDMMLSVMKMTSDEFKEFTKFEFRFKDVLQQGQSDWTDKFYYEAVKRVREAKRSSGGASVFSNGGSGGSGYQLLKGDSKQSTSPTHTDGEIPFDENNGLQL